MAFAAAEDVTTRLGIEATASQTASIELLLETASGIIEADVGKMEDDFDDPIPAAVKGICIELVVRAFSNPKSLSSHSKTLGQFSESEVFNRSAEASLALTENEQLILSRAVWGRTSGSARTDQRQLEDVIAVTNGDEES